MASRLPLCVLIALCVSPLANGAQPALELNGLDALALQKQRGAQFDKDVNTAVEKKLMDGTGEPMTPTTGSGGTKSSGKSTPAGSSTDQPPPSFGTTKAPGQKDAFTMTPLNRVLAALIALHCLYWLLRIDTSVISEMLC
uniref:FKBP_N domain-containing protein n=1 Tax=Globodera pallida TaxID=36090 RepID=A0A183BK98_GLOPA